MHNAHRERVAASCQMRFAESAEQRGFARVWLQAGGVRATRSQKSCRRLEAADLSHFISSQRRRRQSKGGDMVMGVAARSMQQRGVVEGQGQAEVNLCHGAARPGPALVGQV